jgi:cyanophycinase-like exopeptidase
VFLEVEYRPLDQAATRARFLRAKGLWLPGGDQGLFMQRLGSSFAKDLFQLAHRRGVSVFGTSAGAMLMSDPMIDGWEDNTRPKRSPGLGLIPVLVDTHYRERERQGRLRFAFENWNSHTRALGLSEGEWILWQGGRVRQSSGRPEWVGSPALPQSTGRRKVQI